MKINVNDSIYLSEINEGDKAAYLEYLKEKQIYDQTMGIPYPYTEQDADDWIGRVTAQTQKQGQPVSWAIRTADGKLIGGIGCDNLEIGKSHKAELGYWLAKPFWGRGIMTASVRTVCAHAFANFGLARIQAGIFDFNIGSCRVLEKNGFLLEGLLKNYYLKDGKHIDCKMYALLR